MTDTFDVQQYGQTKIYGLKYLEKTFKRLNLEHQKEAANKAVEGGALIILQHAKINAPVKTGFMRSSIQAAVIKAPQEFLAEARVVVGAFYGIFVEMGTKRMAARPFLRKAADEWFKEATRAIGLVLAAMIARLTGQELTS